MSNRLEAMTIQIMNSANSLEYRAGGTNFNGEIDMRRVEVRELERETDIEASTGDYTFPEHPLAFHLSVVTMQCCAWKEIHGIQNRDITADMVIARVITERTRNSASSNYLFTVTTKLCDSHKEFENNQGEALADRITELQFGHISPLGKVKASNGHTVQSWVWQITNEHEHHLFNWWHTLKLQKWTEWNRKGIQTSRTLESTYS